MATLSQLMKLRPPQAFSQLVAPPTEPTVSNQLIIGAWQPEVINNNANRQPVLKKPPKPQ
jgi:hypothetical protein